MFFRKVALATLACASIAQAQNACNQKTTNIQSDGDVQKLASCSTVKGDIIVGEDVTQFQLAEVQGIEGDLVIEKATGLTSIDMPKVRFINGNFKLTGLTILNTLSAPQLGKVGSIEWVTLPALQSLTFTRTVTEADDVLISDTQLGSLEGLNLKTVGTFDINNNKQLRNVDLQLQNVTKALRIEFNKFGGKSVQVNLPNLETVQNATFRDAQSVSVPSLYRVDNSIAFVNNTFESLSLPNLTDVGESIAWVSNSKLTNISAPILEDVGGTFQIANNTKLTNVDGFPELKTVGGAVDMAGTFENATLSSLEDVRGGFNFQTTSKFDCAEFETLKDDQVIKGDDFVCAGDKDVAESKDGSTSTVGGKNGNGSGAAGLVVNGGLLVATFMAAVAFL
ncbi:hypothetical protein BJ508DRAFT_327903 [Ascobolus immersus RN42]|uniref:GPI-anchored cell wall organization protein Ecm33 n=1 Tax=Ascobolus immersus RN42 TaxID=1160509 RepID=A0A3N4I6W9_ASCIM|nr:hypothetical protein BJ508DRAFT_327903 [Ascobolus immersus RN42]